MRREFVTNSFCFGRHKVEWVTIFFKEESPPEQESECAYLKTSPNLSDTRMVRESFVNANWVGLFGNSLDVREDDEIVRQVNGTLPLVDQFKYRELP